MLKSLSFSPWPLSFSLVCPSSTAHELTRLSLVRAAPFRSSMALPQVANPPGSKENYEACSFPELSSRAFAATVP